LSRKDVLGARSKDRSKRTSTAEGTIIVKRGKKRSDSRRDGVQTPKSTDLRKKKKSNSLGPIAIRGAKKQKKGVCKTKGRKKGGNEERGTK